MPKENIPLAPYTTMKVGGVAGFFSEVKNDEELKSSVEFAKKNNIKIFILGGGSNVLVDDSGFGGLVIRPVYQGTEYRDFKDGISVIAGAGVSWDVLVEETVDRGLCGLENLSHIPGLVGASAVQNIGAYGVEAKDFLSSVRVFDMESEVFKTFTNTECHFGYRHSIFKTDIGKKFVITHVEFALPKNTDVNIEYKDLKEFFANKKPNAREVRNAVIEIRQKKLPNLKEYGTAGSFFVNAVVSSEKYNELKNKYPDLPGFENADGSVKISSGWIIDKVLGLKNFCVNDACVYEKQALVLVNKKNAKAEDVKKLSKIIQEKFYEATLIELKTEVVFV